MMFQIVLEPVALLIQLQWSQAGRTTSNGTVVRTNALPHYIPDRYQSRPGLPQGSQSLQLRPSQLRFSALGYPWGHLNKLPVKPSSSPEPRAGEIYVFVGSSARSRVYYKTCESITWLIRQFKHFIWILFTEFWNLVSSGSEEFGVFTIVLQRVL